MKPITILFEIDATDYGKGRWIWKPGSFKAPFKDGWLRRYWWGFFAIAFVRMSLFDYNRHIERGLTEWRD